MCDSATHYRPYHLVHAVQSHVNLSHERTFNLLFDLLLITTLIAATTLKHVTGWPWSHGLRLFEFGIRARLYRLVGNRWFEVVVTCALGILWGKYNSMVAERITRVYQKIFVTCLSELEIYFITNPVTELIQWHRWSNWFVYMWSERIPKCYCIGIVLWLHLVKYYILF